MQVYNTKRSAMFKGTIAVCVIYGLFFLGILGMTAFTEMGRSLFAERLLPFTITMLAGTGAVVVLLLISIFTFKPTHVPLISYSQTACPDYWTFQTTPAATIQKMLDPSARFTAAYQCTVNQNVQSSAALVGMQSVNLLQSTDASSPFSPDLVQSLSNYSINIGQSDPTHFDCTQGVYPTYLSTQDNQLYPNQPNTMRCALAQQCGIQWSSVC